MVRVALRCDAVDNAVVKRKAEGFAGHTVAVRLRTSLEDAGGGGGDGEAEEEQPRPCRCRCHCSRRGVFHVQAATGA